MQAQAASGHLRRSLTNNLCALVMSASHPIAVILDVIGCNDRFRPNFGHCERAHLSRSLIEAVRA